MYRKRSQNVQDKFSPPSYLFTFFRGIFQKRVYICWNMSLFYRIDQISFALFRIIKVQLQNKNKYGGCSQTKICQNLVYSCGLLKVPCTVTEVGTSKKVIFRWKLIDICKKIVVPKFEKRSETFLALWPWPIYDLW